MHLDHRIEMNQPFGQTQVAGEILFIGRGKLADSVEQPGCACRGGLPQGCRNAGQAFAEKSGLGKQGEKEETGKGQAQGETYSRCRASHFSQLADTPGQDQPGQGDQDQASPKTLPVGHLKIGEQRSGRTEKQEEKGKYQQQEIGFGCSARFQNQSTCRIKNENRETDYARHP